jgi:hypothetical protein
MDRITIRLGTLAAPLIAAAKAARLTPLEFARQALAKQLGEPVPAMPAGFQVAAVKRKAVKTIKRQARERRLDG